MGKQGPCRHCGVTSTPLWRNGPPEKPVLCNACGSRWRTKGSLTNYTPLHCRGPLDSDEIVAPTVKQISFKPKEQNPHKKKQNNNVVGIKHEFFEGDISNRSSSGSVISCSESCAQFAITGASNLTGPAQSHAWDPLVPSKRRTCGPYSKASPVEKLAKDLYTILHKQQLSNVSGYSEEDLLYECETPLGSIETGHGGVLIRYPNSKTLQEESEASSLPIDSKPCATNGAFVNTDCKGMSFSNAGNEKRKKLASQATEGLARRDSVSDEKLDILRHRDSPLGSTDLKDIATLEVFMKHLSQEEQQRLMRYLPSIDNTKPPESLKSMFQNPQFIESLLCFQKVLLEGIFDLSFSGANDEDRRSLKRLLLLNLTKSKWVEHYNKLKDVKGKSIAGGKKATTPVNYARHPNMTPLKRSRDSHNPQYEESKGDKRSPNRTSKSGDTNPTSMNSSSKLIHEVDNFIASEVASLSSTSFFASPPDQRSVMGSFTCTGESSDYREELLLDVPIHGSFPDAELLFRPWDKKPFLSNNPSSEFHKPSSEATVVEKKVHKDLLSLC